MARAVTILSGISVVIAIWAGRFAGGTLSAPGGSRPSSAALAALSIVIVSWIALLLAWLLSRRRTGTHFGSR